MFVGNCDNVEIFEIYKYWFFVKYQYMYVYVNFI